MCVTFDEKRYNNNIKKSDSHDDDNDNGNDGNDDDDVIHVLTYFTINITAEHDCNNV